MSENKFDDLYLKKAYRIGKLMLELIDLLKDIIWVTCFYHICNSIIVIGWFSIIMPLFIVLATAALFNIPRHSFDHISIYFGLDLFF